VASTQQKTIQPPSFQSLTEAKPHPAIYQKSTPFLKKNLRRDSKRY
jgi:hypothetical protein